MAGLSVLLEPQSKSHPGGKAAPAAQVISKATLVIHRQHQQQIPAAAATGFFMQLQLQRCCLCNRELADGMDIYMYRGDRAFCSEECRCRQILMDDDAAVSDGCGNGAGAGAGAAVRGSRRVAGRGRVANAN